MSTMHEFDPDYPRPVDAPKFTPGPWSVAERNSHLGNIATVYGCTAGWVDIWSEHWMDVGLGADVQDANIALIATAPELYEAAAHAQAWISDMPHGDNCYLSAHYDGDPGNQCNCGKESVLAALDAALAKAATP